MSLTRAAAAVRFAIRSAKPRYSGSFSQTYSLQKPVETINGEAVTAKMPDDAVMAVGAPTLEWVLPAAPQQHCFDEPPIVKETVEE